MRGSASLPGLQEKFQWKSSLWGVRKVVVMRINCHLNVLHSVWCLVRLQLAAATTINNHYSHHNY